MVTRALFAALLALSLPVLGCRTPKAKTLTFAPGMLAKEQGKASPETPPVRRPYVVRLAEGGRVWEVDLPEDAAGYEVRIPLGESGDLPRQVTGADRELLGTAEVEAASPKESLAAPSYLGGVARVNELYRSQRLELALIEVVELERAFPKDARLAAMKGSLYLKLGRHALAKEAYLRALQLDPGNAPVAAALESIEDLGGAR